MSWNSYKTDPRYIEAKRLMAELTKEHRDKERAACDNDLCRCGHKRVEHSFSLSINYTEGFCNHEGCNCENFLMK